jgi:hypothetical protein
VRLFTICRLGLNFPTSSLYSAVPGVALEATTDELMPQVVRANMSASVNYLRQGSEVIERMMEEEGEWLSVQNIL